MMNGPRSHSRISKLPLLLLAMKRHLLLKFAVESLTAKQHLQFFKEASNRVHSSLLYVLHHTANSRNHLFKLR